MAYGKRDNTGALFKNLDKDPGNPSHEKWGDYEGSVSIGGVQYWLTGWIKKPTDPTKKSFISLAFKPKQRPPTQPQSKPQQPPPRKPAPPRDSDLDPPEEPDIPF